MTRAKFPPGLDWLGEIPDGMERPVWWEWIQDCPPVAATRRSWDRPTIGGAVAASARLVGFELMPWQAFVADVGLEYRLVTVDALVDGQRQQVEVPLLWYRNVWGTVPRQSGKTSLGVPVKLHRALAWPELAPAPWGGPQNIVYTAQDGNSARRKWDREHVPRIERSKFVSPLVSVRRTNGSEQIRFTNGSTWAPMPATETAGHGETLDLHFGDEAFALPDDRLDQSMRPAMITRPNAQQWIWSTQGDDDSHYLNDKCDLGAKAVADGVTEGVAFFNWAAPEGADPNDLAVWPRFHPAVGFTQTAETLKAEMATWKDQDRAKRAFFNWRQTGSSFEAPVDLDAWTECEVAPDSVDIEGGIALAATVSLDQSGAWIAWAGWRSDGTPHVELDYHILADPLELPERMVEITTNPDNEIAGTVVNPAGPVNSLLKLMARLGVDDIHLVSAREYAGACGLMANMVHARAISHVGQIELAAAIRALDKRKLSDAFAWAQRPDMAPIGPFEAATLALGHLMSPQVEDAGVGLVAVVIDPTY